MFRLCPKFETNMPIENPVMTCLSKENITSKSASDKKNSILLSTYEHLYPGRVSKLIDGGINFVPDERCDYRYCDVDGHEVLDLHLNGGTFNLGHRNPKLVDILKKSLDHYDIGNHHFPSEPKARLAQTLIECTPGDMQYVVLTPSASEANDVAIKSARFATGRRKIVALDAGYHGRTGLSGAAGDSETAKFFHSDYPDEFITVAFNDLTAMKAALANNDVALVMMETLPATYGFPLPEAGYLTGVKKLCETHGSLFLADEVQTGLGRTGYRWAIEAWGVEPDMLVTGKGLSGGLYPMAALVMNKKTGNWLKDNGWGHVSTFGGADLGCEVAIEAIKLSLAESTLNNVKQQAEYIRQGLDTIKPRFPFFKEIRQKGLVMGLQFSDSAMAYGMMRALYEKGIWAIVAAFDESVLQFKPGLLVDKNYCDELLSRFEEACIWLVNNLNELMMGAKDEQDPELAAIQLLAEKVISHWDIQPAKMNLIKHRENTVFKITAQSGEHFALRIHRHAYHTNEELRSELIWMAALIEQGVRTPNVIKTQQGKLFTRASFEGVKGERQCSLLEWVEGKEFHHLGRVEKGVQAELEIRYEDLGVLAGKLHNQSEQWKSPETFTRQSWDEKGLLGESPLWGRFWEHPLLSREQIDLFLKARLVLQLLLKDLGKSKENYGLIHADFLPENILVNNGELQLIDFDDSGYGWHLFEMATSLFPQADQPFFDELIEAYVSGYRSQRPFSDEQLKLLPAFIMIRAFTYLGWLMTRSGSLKNGDKIALKIAEVLCEYVPELLSELSTSQRVAVEVMHAMKKIIRSK